MNGFIDERGDEHERIDRLEILVNEALKRIPIDALSSEAQILLIELDSGDPVRRQRAQSRIHRMMRGDPLARLDEYTEPPTSPDSCHRRIRDEVNRGERDA